MVLIKNINFNYFLYFILGFCLGMLFGSNVVFAAPNCNENNNFDDINSLTQFTTLNDILSDTAYRADKDEILDFVLRCAGADNTLTREEYNSIIKQADFCHIKMMEENYNAGWNQ